MKSIRLENIRCLEDTGFIEIKPLTIILGENSSGKSTFVRTFPLLRQSVKENPKGPILFYGEFVDFGELKNLITKDTKKDSIVLSFKLDVNLQNLFAYRTKNDATFEVDIVISIKDQGNNIPYLSSYEIRFHNYIIEFKFENEKVISVVANGEKFEKYFSDVRSKDDGRFAPVLLEKKTIEGSLLGCVSLPLVQPHSNWYHLTLPSKLETELINLMNAQHRKGTAKATIIDLIQGLSYVTLKEGDVIKKMPYFGTSKTWRSNAENMGVSTSKKNEFKKIENIISLNIATLLSEKLDLTLRETFSSIRYVAPVRATAERYYRKRNIAVSEVDFRGENLSMYIASLPNHKMDKLTVWLEENFSLRLHLGRETGHLTLEIQHVGSDHIFNIADMGFGFSQVMPILVQLWSIIEGANISRRRFKVPIIYVMEQPELHLHPRLQAVLADVLCKAVVEAKASNVDLRIVIETHSESIVSKIGRNIASKIITEDLTNLTIFNKLPNENTSKVTQAKYNNKGQLESWPWGFFD